MLKKGKGTVDRYRVTFDRVLLVVLVQCAV